MSLKDELPKSRITMSYTAKTNKTSSASRLPPPTLITGHFSLRTSKNRDLDLEQIASTNSITLNEAIKTTNNQPGILHPISEQASENKPAKRSFQRLFGNLKAFFSHPISFFHRRKNLSS